MRFQRAQNYWNPISIREVTLDWNFDKMFTLLVKKSKVLFCKKNVSFVKIFKAMVLRAQWSDSHDSKSILKIICSSNVFHDLGFCCLLPKNTKFNKDTTTRYTRLVHLRNQLQSCSYQTQDIVLSVELLVLFLFAAQPSTVPVSRVSFPLVES